jgi:hypothetical protein
MYKSNILENFIKLTKYTCPYGEEDDLVLSMIIDDVFPCDIKKDIYGNYFYEIGKSRTIFASHLDTVSKNKSKINHIYDGNFIKTDGTTILGADDKAGVVIMLYMIENKIPGLYYFFVGEEVGCIGSKQVSSKLDIKNKYDRIISFDRKDTNSIITYQSFTRCCSDEFADALAFELNLSGFSYKKDEYGVYTDSAEFTSVIPECTNISVGYYNEHTVNEKLDINHLEKLSKACLLVDWEGLPTKRDYNDLEYGGYSGCSGWSKLPSRKKYDYSNYFEDEFYSNEDINPNYSFDFDGYWVKLPNGEDKFIKNKHKKTRRSNNRKYYDNGNGELVPFKNSNKIKKHSRNYYDILIDKIIKEDISIEELEIIKDQYLDMTKQDDINFYNYLLGNVI